MSFGGVDLGTAYGRIILDATGVDAGIREAQRSVTEGMRRVGDSIRDVGVNLTALTAPILAFGVTGIRTAGEFDDAMREIEARTGLTGEALDRLRDTAIQLGADTVFGANDAAESLLQLLSSGMSVEEALAALPAVLDAAAAGGVDLAFAADAATDIMAMFGLEATDARQVVDALTRAAGSGSASFDDLAFGFQNVGGIAAQFGLSVEETAAILQIFSENGIKGAEAGTQLRSMLNNMVRDTDDVRGMWQRLGVELFDAQGQMRPLSDVMAELTDAMAGMTDEERIEALRTLGGAYGQLGLAALTSGGDIDAMLASMEDASDAATVADARMSGWTGAVENLSGSIETFQLEVLTPFMNNVLSPLVTRLADVVNGFTEWAQANPEVAQSLVAVLAGLVLLGPTMIIVGQVISSSSVVLKALGASLGLLLSPMGLVIAGVLALGAGLAYLISNDIWGLGTAFKTLGQIFGNIIGDVVSIAGDFLSIAGSIARMLGLIGPDTGAEDAVSGFFDAIIGPLNEFSARLDGFRQLVDAFALFMDVLSGPIDPGEFSNMLQVLDDVAKNPLVQMLLGRTDLTGEDLLNAFMDIRTGIIELFSDFPGFFSDTILPGLQNALSGLIETVFTWISEQAPALIEQLGAWAKSFADWIGPAISDLLLALPGIITGILTWILEQIPTLAAQLLEWAAEFVNWVGPAIGDLIPELGRLLSRIITWVLEDMIPAIAAQAPRIIDAFFTFIGRMVTEVGPELGNFLTSIVNFITNELIPGVADAARNIGEAIVNGIRTGIENIWGSVSGWFEDQVNNLVNGVTGLLGIQSPSKVFTGIGENIVAGLLEGLDNAALLENATASLVNPLLAGAQTPQPAFATAGATTTTYNLTVERVELPPLAGVSRQEQARSFLDALEEEIERRG